MMIDGINQLPATLPKGHDALTVATPHLPASDPGKTEIFGDKNLWSFPVTKFLQSNPATEVANERNVRLVTSNLILNLAVLMANHSDVHG